MKLMKHSFILLLTLSCALLWSAAPGKKAAKPPRPKLKITCAPATHIVKAGEKVDFSITSDSELPIQVIISLDGSNDKIFKKLTVKSPAVVSASLAYPGFLHCAATSGRTTARAGVAVEPEKIRYARKPPKDFDAFWKSALEESAKLPLDLKIEAINPHPDFESYLISCANVNGKRAYGFYSAPKKRSKKMPLVVLFGGGEAYVAAAPFPGSARKMSTRFKESTAVLYLHLPPYRPEMSWEKARQTHKEFLKKINLRRYIIIGLEDPHPRKFYAYSAILGGVRLIKAVSERKEIDHEKLFFHGASHGGKLGAYFAYFLPFKAVFLGVPSSCEINAHLEKRYGSAAREWKNHHAVTDYFDLVYFAPGIKCPVLVGVGFWDRSCPPTGVYSFYNAIPDGKKKIINKIHDGHGGAPPEYHPATWKFLVDHLNK